METQFSRGQGKSFSISSFCVSVALLKKPKIYLMRTERSAGSVLGPYSHILPLVHVGGLGAFEAYGLLWGGGRKEWGELQA